MKVLLIGSGGREHALAWKLSQSPRLSQLYITPGNAGTAQLANPARTDLLIENVAIQPQTNEALCAFAVEKNIDLAIIGPEIPLAAGLADALIARGCNVFGPSQAAAQIEVSKAFSKAFMARHNIPTPCFAVFDNLEAARAHLHTVGYPIVIKASGLAAGKGVIIPHSAQEAQAELREIMLDGKFGAAGDQVVIEEWISGREVSLLAFTDGVHVRPMPPVQDHKRLLEADGGPNTGGMGTFAPAPSCPPALVEQCVHTILQPTVDGLRAEGSPFVGVLYAGLMLTPQGPTVLEFNCRFGDPETQVIMPLLDTDLLLIAQACAEGTLASQKIDWKSASAACVVLVSGGYPADYEKGHAICGLDSPDFPGHAIAFHAGTSFDPQTNATVTAGGRVLGMTAWAQTLQQALDAAYQATAHISFEGMQYRHDIGGTYRSAHL